QTPRPVLAFIMVPAWAGDARADLVASLTEGRTTALADPVLTHTLHNYNDDPINQHLHRLGFAAANHTGNVTAIYVPCYLNGRDGVFDMGYYDLLIGMDATVFPSYYEPWGYTPLESVAFGVPTITTTLSGFGQWICSTSANTFAGCGAVAVQRTDSNYHQVVRDIADDLLQLMKLDNKSQASISAAAMATAARADWNQFIKYYDEAYQIALDNNSK
ncbi:MAG: glycosyltransferase, partial [Muribaculaceae bacterium]|nr:glycosyltransferase [Muribaculaceae bacterium]